MTSPAARPGDAAREALRRAATRGSGPHPDPSSGADPVPDRETASSAQPGPVRPSARAETADAPSADVPPAGTRPGDIAREALRAARTEARQARTAAETKGAGSAHRSAERAAAGARARRDRRDQDRGGRVRDVREVLAEAFELPGAEAPRETTDTGRPAHPDTDTKTDVETENDSDIDTETALDANSDTKTDAEADAERGRRTVHPAHPALPTQPRLSEASTIPSAVAVPRSMASPRRDGELRRTFEALPARTSHADTFAETWWGNAWVRALEEGALDAARLARGGAYADRGHVDAITVTPGTRAGLCPREPPAAVPRPGPTADAGRRRLGPFPRRGGRAPRAHRGPPRQGDAQVARGLRSRPAPRPRRPGTPVQLPDHGHPCKHAAALCYQTARLLDEDPFAPLLLRGRGERELLDALSRRNATRAARAAQEQQSAPLPGVRACAPRVGRCRLSRRRCPPPRTPSSRRSTRARRAAPTRSRWTSSPRTRPPAHTRCSPRAATRSRS